ncbi:filamentous hemagglutinin [Actimicrobium sp. GrIS 1.19]|uniref:filamentous haemagglutinin family protein n=1 Tax=Actimicrobium sp. GrIS 1.19 TaxID=3071708 RepID=UPI002DFEBA82|nr:filamentous hemagglutinin [Actimicrobium sp. GrIS 1.19]
MNQLTESKKKIMRTLPSFYRRLPGLASVTVLMATGALVCVGAAAQTVRTPRIATSLPTGPASQPLAVGSTTVRSPRTVAGTFAPYSVSGNTATITQTGPAGILSWEGFDIGSDATLNVVQPSSTAVLLNKVDGGLSQSFIDGALNANGHVYIYNPNGIVFGKTANINVNTLVATTLKIDDSRFLGGILQPNLAPIFAADPSYAGTLGSVLVEGDGSGRASLNAQRGGKILLVGQSVTNNGALSAPDGQVVLAAGGKVYLAAPSDASMRGVLVEVSNSNLTTAGGAATNGATGMINVERGNATLVGLAVNQLGNVSATTSLNLNGSIYLRARDGADKGAVTDNATATHGGTLTLGAASRTQISVVDDKSTGTFGPTDPAFKQSQVDLSGSHIFIQDNAQILAQSGNVSITARANPTSPDVIQNDSRVDFGAGSLIDVSGGKDTKLAADSNVIAVQLLSEVADNVLLRTSSLRGKTLRFDIRKTTQIADISADIAKIASGVGERTAVGGKVTVMSEGDIIQRAGSTINVSGGQIGYLAGYVNTTKLKFGGSLYDLSTASANRIYDGVVDLPNGRNFEAAYFNGKDAGTVQFSAPVIVMQGALKADTVLGQYQREVGSTLRPLGGKLIIGNDSISSLSTANLFGAGYLGEIVIGGATTSSAVAPAATDAFDLLGSADQALLAKRLDLDSVALAKAGFSRITAVTAGDINVVAPVALAAGGELAMGTVGNIAFNAGVTARGGSVSAKALGTTTVNDGANFDLSGTWRNDAAVSSPSRDGNGNATGDVVTKGGKLDLSGSELTIGKNVAIDVSGGAWLSAQKKLKKGDAGSISLKAIITDASLAGGSWLRLDNTASLSAYSMGKGGTLNLQGANVFVGGAIPTSNPENDLYLQEALFSQGGFTKFDIGALGNLDVAAGASLSPRASSWRFNDFKGYASVASGSMRDVAAPALLDVAGPAGSRTPTSVTLRATSEIDPTIGNVRFGTNASLTTDPGATVTLLAGNQLTVDGTIDAPAGTIIAGLTPQVGAATTFYSDTRSIWFGANAHLMARGSAALLSTNGNGITTGEVLDGGRIQIGQVLASGGLTSATGYIVAEAGSTFDVSGAVSGPVSFLSGRNVTDLQQISSAGGSIDLQSREGILFSGAARGSAGGAGSNGGSLSIAIDRQNVALNGETGAPVFTLTNGAANGHIPTGLKAGDKIADLEGQAWLATDSFSGGGFARLGLKSQNLMTFSLTGGPLSLNAAISIILDAPNFTATNAGSNNVIALNAAYVQFGNADSRYQTAQNSIATDAGKAALTINANTIDLIGHTSLQGFSKANFNAAEDVRLVGVTRADLSQPQTTKPADSTDLSALGQLDVTGDVTLRASRIYPTTLSKFTLNAVGANSTLSFANNSRTAVLDTPLSASGVLIGQADHIVQDGWVVAPFGSIRFDAREDINYAANSITSVAGSGLIPFGRVENGRDWVYDYGNGNSVAFKLNPGATGNLVESGLPEKSITAKAPSIKTALGATLDLTGGGDLYSYEFTPGSNGTADVLKSSGTTAAAKVFAINPNFTSSVAPRDFQYGQDGGLLPGDRIYLSAIAAVPGKAAVPATATAAAIAAVPGTPALAAGYYTLLPAHYALLDGGLSVTLAPNSRDMSSTNNVVNLDHSATVAGNTTAFGLGAARTSGFIVSSGDVIRRRGDYQGYTGNAFFTAQAAATGVAVIALPADGGRVAFDAIQSLVLAGQIKLGATGTGRRGSADISAPDIVVVADKDQVVAGNALKLVASDLTALGADSLLLGGLRDLQADGNHVTVGANSVTVQNDQNHVLSGPEIILAARNTVLVDAGSVVKGEGTLRQKPQNLIISSTDSSGNQIGTDGALLRLSGGAAVSILRDAPGRNAGLLDIRQGAVIAATGSAYLDATMDTRFNGNFALAGGAALGLGAARISLGDGIPQDAAGLHFDTAGLTALSALSALELNSYSSIDLYGIVKLGSAATTKLTLRGSGLQGYDTPADVRPRQASLVADTVQFAGATSALAPSGSTAGALGVQARNIEFGTGAFAINGYGNSVLNANGEARAVGIGSLVAQQDLTLAAGRIVANGLSNATVQAVGHLTLTNSAQPLAATTIAPMGGRLNFLGDTIVSDAQIKTPSGQINLLADNGVRVSGGNISAAGSSITFGSTTAYAGAGSITLNGGTGNVAVDTAATLDVSAVGAAAGSLTVKAVAGTATMDGTLLGGSSAEQTRGRFAMDVARLTSAGQFDVLNAKLNNAGFTESRDFRVRQDDVTLSGLLQAHQAVISADNGNVTISGAIDATGSKGGSIELYASQASAVGTSGNVRLANGATLLARATVAASNVAGSTGDGGRVVIGTGNADGNMAGSNAVGSNISLEAGSTINVSGLGAGGSGSVLLRAPRVGSSGGDDVAISHIDSNIVGSTQTTIEGYKTYTTTKVSQLATVSNGDGTYSNLQVASAALNAVGNPVGLIYSEGTGFANNVAAINARLGANAASVQAGIDIRSTGDLLVSVNETATNAEDRGWNLNAWRFNNAPGALTLRAAGNLTIAGSISDGFVKPQTTVIANKKLSMPTWALDNKASWSYRLAGGADLGAANPLAVNLSSANGDVSLQFARSSSSLTDQPVSLVRTGSGRIDVAAGRDVVLGTNGNTNPNLVVAATIYTAGMHIDTVAANNFAAPTSFINSQYGAATTAKSAAEFAGGGGGVTIHAMRDVVGVPVPQLINNWLFRQGRTTIDANGNTVFAKVLSTTLNTAWWSRFDYFNQGVATFGGGDISVIAETGSVRDLSASVVTNAYVPGTSPSGKLVESGGGDLVVRAGGDVLGGAFYVQKGVGTINADGAIKAGSNLLLDPTSTTGIPVALNTILALGDAKFGVTAREGVALESAFNPTLTPQSNANYGVTRTPNSLLAAQRTNSFSNFSTYGDDSGVRLTATAGDVLLSNRAGLLGIAGGPTISLDGGTYNRLFSFLPGSVDAIAMSGNLSSENGFVMAGAPRGQLSLLAGGTVDLKSPRLVSIVMLDVGADGFSPYSAPRVLRLSNPGEGDSALLDGTQNGLSYHSPTGLHTVDDASVRVIALTGDVVGDKNQVASLILSKKAEIIAGRDIQDLGFKVQHLAASDVTRVVAGRDIVDSTIISDGLNPNVVGHTITGPGHVDFIAGRNFDLGDGSGIVTRGNLDNPYLPAGGSSINILAGSNSADYSGYARKYIDAKDLSTADQTAMIAYVAARQPAISSNASANDAWVAFKTLSVSDQNAFLDARKPDLNKIFFAKLTESSKIKDLVVFDAQIASLYPTLNPAGGNINVFGSQLKTEQGGSINLFAPNGSVFAGLANTPSYLKKLASTLGIFTVRGGEVASLVKTDFLVNQGRVFTLGGGDITLVSQYGDLNAGKGTKTASSAPPPLLTTDQFGNTVIDISGSISGSGIATLKTADDQPNSSIYAVAPRGTFDAGDAGVRSSGSIQINAAFVLNAGNIVASGSVSGVPAVEPSASASAAIPTSATPRVDDIAKTLAAQTPQVASTSTTLSVDVLGFGDGSTPAPAESKSSDPADEKRKKKQSN